jgi:hypothetical protein
MTSDNYIPPPDKSGSYRTMVLFDSGIWERVMGGSTNCIGIFFYFKTKMGPDVGFLNRDMA